jgi:hypothetical protein
MGPSIAAELVAMQLLRREREEVAGVEFLIAKEFERFALILVRAASGGEVDETGLGPWSGMKKLICTLNWSLAATETFSAASPRRPPRVCTPLMMYPVDEPEIAGEENGVVATASLTLNRIGAAVGRHRSAAE